MSIPVPPRIGKYELEEYLGGGMSAVYRAKDTLMGRLVAVKILKEAYRPEDPVAQRFMLEAQIAGNLNHENVIRTYDFGFDPEGRPFMVLEFLDGEDLAQAIKGNRTASLQNQARIGVELASALEYIHPRNIIHRDLKPANVFLAGFQTQSVKLMDFGIARSDNASITQAGTTMGTPGYMAPEQVRGETVTKAADIYAFGVVLWEMLTGTRAFSGDTLDRVFYMVLNESLDLERLRARGIPDELCAQIGKCASKEAWKRPTDLQGIRQELLRLADPGRAPAAPARSSDAETVAMPIPMLATMSAAAAAVPPPPPTTTRATVNTNTTTTTTTNNNKKLIWAGVGGLATVSLIAVALMLLSGGGGDDSVKKAAAGKGPAGSNGPAQKIETPTGPMMLVPESAFRFGKDQQSAATPPFYVDRTEVTNEAFAAYARATGAALPPGFVEGKPDLPVVNVTLDEALGFAQWAGKRLPTSKQWEKAARGLDGRTYPWGEQADATRANVGAGTGGSLAPVTAFAEGASPFQALQMVGNAWEWVDETAAPSAATAARFATVLSPPPAAGERWVEVRGGSFFEKLDPGVMWDAAVMPARFRSPRIGFRCVKAAGD